MRRSRLIGWTAGLAVLLLAATALAASLEASSPQPRHASRPTLTRAAAIGFPFGDDIAANIVHIGVIHFRCTPDRKIIATFVHGNTQHATVRTVDGQTRTFRHGLRFVAPAQPAGRQVWETRFRGESASQTTVVKLDFALTSVSRVCYVRHSTVDATVKPTSR